MRDVYLQIETIPGYSPVEPDDHVTPPVRYRRDCARNPGHPDAEIPADEVAARRLTALVYREYLDPGYRVPRPDRLIATDVNEPSFLRRVPGAVIYTRPGERLRIHVRNADSAPHSLHLHGLGYGIDSDGAWPFGTQAADGRRSDAIGPGQAWTYTFDVTEESVGAWPFHDHHHEVGATVDRGLFGGIIVLPAGEREPLPVLPLPTGLAGILAAAGHDSDPAHRDGDSAATHAAARGAGTEPAGGDVAGRYVAALDELAHAAAVELRPADELLHVPLFMHVMSGARATPVFQTAPVGPGGSATSPILSVPGAYRYVCGIHGPTMSGTVTVVPGGPTAATVEMRDHEFRPAEVTVGVGARVTWTNSGPSPHSVVESGGDSLASYCFNGRTFVGNTPTVLAHAGQRIRWYVFNLDLGADWHNLHLHGARWRSGGQPVDVRSLGPAESFTAETVAPPVLLLPPDIAEAQEPARRSPQAQPYLLRGDFLVHCHVETHMMQGLAALVRSYQTVWLTPEQAAELRASTGLPVDPGGNACPQPHPASAALAVAGRWDEVPGLPQITMMHAVLLPGTSQVLFWGYGPRPDQSRIFDADTGAYSRPANQPQSLTPDENVWSNSHAYLADTAGTILAAGGFRSDHANPVLTTDTERRAFTVDPTTASWARVAELGAARFYPTALTLADGRVLVLYGQDTTTGATQHSLELFTAGVWSPLKPLPFNYFYYPWTFLLPGGDLFVAGPQKPARRFDPAADPVVDDPARRYPQIAPQRGVNMDGTAVLLPLRPPGYAPRVLIAGGHPPDAARSVEWIDLSEPAPAAGPAERAAASPEPAWSLLPDLHIGRDKVNSVLLPDGRVLIVGGVGTLPDGGPVEIFDPEDPAAGFELGPSMRHVRGYHSTAILLPDGSVLMGGDSGGGADGGSTPNERYLPAYFFRPRPTITAAPASISYGAAFTVRTPAPEAISEVVLMRPGAVTHGFDQSQRHVGCAITGRGAAGVQAFAPPDGTVAPPGHYLLFLVGPERTPSTGAWVRLS